MSLRSIAKIAYQILGGGITSVIGQMVGIIDNALNIVKGTILEFSLTKIIRDTEGRVLDEIQARKLLDFIRKWESARRTLARCVSRLDKVVALANKVRPIIRIVRIAFKIISKVSRFLPVGGAAIAEAAVKVDKILGVVETILTVVVYYVGVIRSICARLLALLRSFMTDFGITDGQEREWVQDEQSRPDPYDIFNRSYEDFDVELITIEVELDRLETLRAPQNEEECNKRLNDVMWIINDLDKFVGDIEELRQTQRNEGWLDIEGSNEALQDLLDESYDKLTETRSLIQSIKRDFRIEIENVRGYKGNEKPFPDGSSIQFDPKGGSEIPTGTKDKYSNIYKEIEGDIDENIDTLTSSEPTVEAAKGSKSTNKSDDITDNNIRVRNTPIADQILKDAEESSKKE